MLTRRSLLALLAAGAVTPSLATVAHAEHPSVGYMKQVAKDLLAAHRQGTVPSFLRVVQRHADVPSIAQNALGKYGEKLSSGQKTKYQRGVATYMARYFALQSRDYTVAKYEVGEATVDANKDVLVESKVFLLTGQVYNVAWRLVWRDGRYKVRDAKVLGFWLTNFQRSDFVSYLDKRNGDIDKLIKALYG
jgi:phospholipid transport system substrate-binding protein